MLKFRFYYDKDAEEAWLAEMMEKGWALQGFCLGFYTFTPCEPGEYIYRVDLLPTENAGQYEEFLRDSGVEVVQRWCRWAYLRRKAAEGPFEVYTDAESKIVLYERIRRFFTGALVVEAVCFAMELVSAIETRSPLFWACTGLLLLILVAMARVLGQCARKIEALRRR